MINIFCHVQNKRLLHTLFHFKVNTCWHNSIVSECFYFITKTDECSVFFSHLASSLLQTFHQKYSGVQELKNFNTLSWMTIKQEVGKSSHCPETTWAVDVMDPGWRKLENLCGIKVVLFCLWRKSPRWAGPAECNLQLSGHTSILQDSSALSRSSRQPEKKK